MNKLNLALLGSVLLFPLTSYAGDELDAINVAVEQQAVQLDQTFGVLLTSQERSALKLSLIANKINADQSAASVKEKVESAFTVYEITDPSNQRKLVIETQVVGGSGGVQPPQ